MQTLLKLEQDLYIIARKRKLLRLRTNHKALRLRTNHKALRLRTNHKAANEGKRHDCDIQLSTKNLRICDWSSSTESLKAKLGWLSLAKKDCCRKSLFVYISSQGLFVPASILSRYPRPTRPHKYSQSLNRPFVRTLHHKNYQLLNQLFVRTLHHRCFFLMFLITFLP